MTGQLRRRIREAQRAPQLLAEVMRGVSLGRQPVVKLPAALPVEWITGAHDATYREVARAHCATSDHARHTVVAGTGHNAHLHDPGAVAAVVARAVERLPARVAGGPP